MDPAAGIIELLVVQRGALEEVFKATGKPLCVCLEDPQVDKERDQQRDSTQIKCQLEEASLEKQVQIPVVPSVSAPVLRVQFENNRAKHTPENLQRLGFTVNAAFVYLLNIDVFVNRKLGAKLVEPYLLPEKVGPSKHEEGK